MSVTDIAKKMRARADADELPDDHPLRVAADAFDAAMPGFHGEPQITTVQQFMGAWARARKAWCDYSGEALI